MTVSILPVAILAQAILAQDGFSCIARGVHHSWTVPRRQLACGRVRSVARRTGAIDRQSSLQDAEADASLQGLATSSCMDLLPLRLGIWLWDLLSVGLVQVFLATAVRRPMRTPLLKRTRT